MNASGMNWCRQDFRLGAYLRDGFACVWCGSTIEDGIKLTLDHLVPRSEGGDNGAGNVITACHLCNSRRGDRTIGEFAAVAAGYVNHGVSAADILTDISERTAQSLKPFRAEAKEMIARRGSAAKAVAALKDR